MYAITFDFEVEALKQNYRNPSYNNAYGEVRKVLTEEYGFTWMQGSVYFGDESVDAVVCVMAVQDLKNRFAWFEPSVRDIRMLRIDEDNDLGPALGRGGIRKRARPKAA